MGNDRFFMREEIRVATENGSDPSLAPIGCVIVMNGGVLAACRNQVREHHDAVAHAKALELKGWQYPRHLARRHFGLVAHGDSVGVMIRMRGFCCGSS